jgi:single-stranded-DNA-specific exonuclease
MSSWKILPSPPADFMSSHPEIPPIITRLLWNRNLRTQEQIDEFLNPDYSQDLHDPFLFKDMKKAIKIIFSAIEKQKKIIVHGDYDADGVCAASLIIGCLKKLGAKKVEVFLPHREIDGYGLNTKTINELKKQKTDLIITCDCGISNFEEIKLAKKLGMQIVVTDHHTIPLSVPPADAIIHPLIKDEKYPDKGLAGGGVAFKLVQGLLKNHKKNNATLPDGQLHEAYEKWLLDLVAIATIGDMVPLVGESRTLARYGLTVLNKTRNTGLKQLCITAGIIDESGKTKRGSFDAHMVSFQIVPRLNAAGRMEHANVAFKLLMSTDESKAKKLAINLNKNNLDRQKLTEQIVNEAREQIKTTNQQNNSILFAFGKKWATGILGLVAGKLKDEFYRPILVMTENENEIMGSGRSIAEFNLIAGLQSMPQFFSKFGGHPQACGFSLKNKNEFENFKKTLLEKTQKELGNLDLKRQITVEAEIDLEEVNWKLYDLLQKFEPFGQANEEPRYVSCGLTIVGLEPVGQDGKHIRLMVKHNSHLIRKTIGFGLGDLNRNPEDWKKNLNIGDKIDMVFSIGVNEWNGNRELQMKIEDIKKH